MGWKFLDHEIKSFKDEFNIPSAGYNGFDLMQPVEPLASVQNKELQSKWTAFCVKLDTIVQKHQGFGMFQRVDITEKFEKVVDKALEVIKTGQHDPDGSYKSMIEEIEASNL